MPLNFLNSNLLPKVVQNSPSTEKYEVENLISNQFINKSRGFIAFPSIKPPVHIEFGFICNVNIHYIFLNTTVGTQKCSGIEILGKTSQNSAFVSICKAIYSENGVFFCNKKKFSREQPPPSFNSNYHLAFFRSDTFQVFLNACAIRVVIFRTEKSVPCLACIEVWGEPSRTCSRITKNTIVRLSQKNQLPVEVVASPTKENTDFKIPDDFSDNLTFELMTIPMTLPSGKTIDQLTLEKHIKSEASFGRKPCDPFTGVKFTESLKPILNVGLKSRIDMFLLENSHRAEFFNLRRTLGKINTSGEINCSVNKKLKTSSRPTNKNVELAKTDANQNFYSFASDQNCLGCNLCGKGFEDLYYRIPCEHFYCRTCLLEICKVLECSVCKQKFVKSDVEKVNK